MMTKKPVKNEENNDDFESINDDDDDDDDDDDNNDDDDDETSTFLAGTHFDDGLIASLQQYRLQIIVIFTKLGS